MAELRPFRGVRPPAAWALQVAAPPYDVMSRAEARLLAQGKPRSFLHVSRPEIDLPEGVDEHSDEVHQKGAENLRAFLDRGWLRLEDEPRFYLYRQRMGAHVQVGVVALASVAEYDDGRIVKHELTRAEKEEDRTRHFQALGGQDEPVFLVYRNRPELDALVAEGSRGAPQYDFTSDDGVGHTLWVVPPLRTVAFEQAFHAVPRLYIADGHHRSAAASRVHALRQSEASSRFLAVAFPHDQLQILPYHRVVRDLGELTPERFLEKLAEGFRVEASRGAPLLAPGQFGLYLRGQWLRAEPKVLRSASRRSDHLDVAVLERELLRPLLGIEDARTDARLQFVGGIRGADALEKKVNDEGFAAAFLMHPTSLTELLEVADAGELMPPKSTWFEPKLRSGLVLHLF